MGKIWKDIPGYEGLYKVSDCGDIMSFHLDKEGMLLRAFPKKINGMTYLAVGLQKGSKQKQTFIHRIVASAFLDKPEGCDVVDHINTISTDNRVNNLRWTTPDGNLKNPISHKRRLESVRRANSGTGVNSHKHRGCVQMDLNGRIIKIWRCMSDAWRFLGIDSGCLTRACQGIQQTAGGYKWRYL